VRLRASKSSATNRDVTDSDPRLKLNPDGGLDTLFDMRQLSAQSKAVGSVSMSGGIPSIILDPNKFRFDRMLTRKHLVYGVPTPFVGRRAELEIIYNAVRDAVNDSRLRTVRVVGGSGSGKTRLLAEMFHIIEPETRGIAVLSGVCSAVEAEDDLGVIGQLLRRHFDIGPQESDAIVSERVRLSIGHMVGEDMLDTATGHLGYLMGLPPKDSSRLEEPGALAAFGQRAIRTFYKLLAHQGQRSTQILVFHRAQLMTPRTREVVEGLRAALAETRSVLFFVGDREVSEPSAGDLDVDHHVELTPLSQRHMERMVRGILAKVADPPQSLIDEIVAQAAGCPRLVEDNIRLLVQRGIIRLGGSSWEVLRNESTHTGELARSVEAAAQARMAGMSPETIHILQMASVFGPSFWGGGVLAMLRVRPIGSHRSSVPWFEDEAARWLEGELVAGYEADLVQPNDPATLDGQREFSFSHQTDRDALYERMAPADRAFYHRLAAQWFAGLRLSEPGPWYEVIAEHLVAGERAEIAARWFIKSARLARAHFDLERSVHHYQRALSLVDVDRLDLLVPLLRGLAECLVATEQFDSARRVVSALLEASLAARERETGAWAWLMLGRVHRSLRDYARARPCLENALTMFDDMGDAAGESAVLDEVGRVLWSQGSSSAYDETLSYYERALLIRRRLGDEPTIATSLFGMAEIHLKQGELSRAEASYREALQVRRQLSDGVGEIAALAGLGATYLAKAQHKEALLIWREGLAASLLVGDREANVDFLNRIGETHLDEGNLDEAALYLGQAAQLAQEAGEQRALIDVQRNLAALALARGEFDLAFTLIDQALAMGTAQGAEFSHGLALRTRARILHESVENMPGDNSATLGEARECYEKAISTFESTSEPRELRTTLLGLGSFLEAQGDGSRAALERAKAEELKRS
jgi:tetratricopeptide (TPR) repeat protein